MVHLLFFLRFKAQLRRTRPELIPRLEDLVVRAVERAGGKITGERQVLTAAFDDSALGFWLDILILIETVIKEMDAASADLYGYSLVLGRDLLKTSETSQTPESLCRFLAGGSRGGGVFLDQAAKEKLLPYVSVEEPESWTRSWAAQRNMTNAGKSRAADFCRLDKLKTFSAVAKDSSLRNDVVRSLSQTPTGNTLILGPAFAGKQEGLYQYHRQIAGDFPPLIIRFGAGGLNALTDAWSPAIRSLSRSGAADAEEINGIWQFLFRERLREKLSGFIIGKARRFFVLLLEFYTSAARRRGCVPVLILENIHQAEETAMELFIDAYAGVQAMPGLVVLGTGNGTTDPNITANFVKKWESVFPRIIRLNTETIPAPKAPEISAGIREIAYALSLFSRYFPRDFLLQLFEEEGKNPAMITQALSILSGLGIIDIPHPSVPFPDDWAGIIELPDTMTGIHKERAEALVRNRLLAWVEQEKLNPCFRLLTILADLGGTEYISDRLMLRSIIADLVNGTAAGVEHARNNGLLETLAGPERAAVICYIFETTQALLAKDAAAIRTAFREPPPECNAFPVLKAQVLVNLAAYYLGQRDNAAALETVKEAVLLSQGKNDNCLAQSYRFFSLVSLTRQQTGETINYLDFAMDQAEKSGNCYELGISAYYAAAAQFLFGNIYRAIQLARKAREQALAAGCPEWADRSRFLEGRFLFEVGSYQEALDMFENLYREPLGGASVEREQLLSAWTYRSRVYLQNPLSPKPVNGGYDADIFEIEAAYLAGNYHKTVELASAIINPHTGENFLFTEQPDWCSGFAQCELLYFSHGEIWDRMIGVYHSLALCRLSAAGGEEAMHNMQRILKNEQLSEIDPWDAFYFYAWYRILEQTGAGQVDLNTAISMAFKRLQRRASRIDDIETRRQFLFQPRWNSALSMAAKEFKLI